MSDHVHRKEREEISKGNADGFERDNAEVA